MYHISFLPIVTCLLTLKLSKYNPMNRNFLEVKYSSVTDREISWTQKSKSVLLHTLQVINCNWVWQCYMDNHWILRIACKITRQLIQMSFSYSGKQSSGPVNTKSNRKAATGKSQKWSTEEKNVWWNYVFQHNVCNISYVQLMCQSFLVKYTHVHHSFGNWNSQNTWVVAW